MASRRVAVTGIGMLSPLGLSREASWEAAKNGVSGIAGITRFDASAFSARIAGEVKGYDPSSVIEAKEVKKHDLYSQYSMSAAAEAWEDSGLAGASVPAERIGCVLGIGMGGLSSLEFYHEAYLKSGPRRISPFLIPRMISNMGPGNIAMFLNLKGVNFTITSACTSSTHAIGESMRLIRSGVQDVVLTGGAESTVCPMGIGGFCAMKALSTRNDEPERASRPFERDRDGFVLGEGSTVLVLEEMSQAEARGAKIYAEVKGYGASCDAYHMTAPSPDGEGARSCMQAALEDAELSPESISYVNAHGTSTSANDVTETLAIKEVFGTWAKGGLLVSSTKSMTGHLLGAAGAVEAGFMALSIRDQVVVPTINLENPEEGCDLDYVPHSARDVTLTHALSNSFGFGGTNASLVFSAV